MTLEILQATQEQAKSARPAQAFEQAELDAPDVDIVIPVFNEERIVASTVLRLHRYLRAQMLFSWRITVADNASTDLTLSVARAVAHDLPDVRILHLERKGRGHALRSAWRSSDARVLAYMDVDLSTDLSALEPLLAPLLSGRSEVAIGSRLASGAQVSRGRKREFISRSYNHLLQLSLRARFSDAQCGFKALRADVARQLVAEVEDDGWFFDTELLVLAQRRGLRIDEVPVEWVDDPQSSVDILSTAVADLLGIVRLALRPRAARFSLTDVPDTAHSDPPRRRPPGSTNAPGLHSILSS